MRKVFISFLGTNNYLETYYELNGERTVKPVRFIQEALIDFICKGWSEDDVICIFNTDDSEIKNWLNNGHSKIRSEIDNIGLKEILERKGILPSIKSIKIADGFSEEEIWRIFNSIYEQLIEDDLVYLDVTHAFRSIPMFSTILFNFAKVLKKISLRTVHYGAFEKLGPAYEVEKMDVINRIAPIIDLTNLIDLQRLTETANNFIQFGKISSIGQINIISEPVNKLQLRINEAIRVFRLNVSSLDNYINTCRLIDIKSGIYIRNITDSIKTVCKSEEITPAEHQIFNALIAELADFVPENSNRNIEAAIEWAYKYNMIQQAYTMSTEYIIALVCEKLKDKNPFLDKDKDKKFRMFINAILGMNNKDISEKNFKGELNTYLKTTEDILGLEWIHKLRKEYKILCDNRNVLNHGKGTKTSAELTDQFRESYDNSLNSIQQIIQSC